MSVFFRVGANVLSINQNIHVDSVALVSVTVRMKEDLPREEILRRLRALPGVVEATVL